MIGPQCHVTVSICIMQLIQNFIKFCSKEKRMILAAKLFPILNRRFDDFDLRVSRQESISIRYPIKIPVVIKSGLFRQFNRQFSLLG